MLAGSVKGGAKHAHDAILDMLNLHGKGRQQLGYQVLHPPLSAARPSSLLDLASPFQCTPELLRIITIPFLSVGTLWLCAALHNKPAGWSCRGPVKTTMYGIPLSLMLYKAGGCRRLADDAGAGDEQARPAHPVPEAKGAAAAGYALLRLSHVRLSFTIGRDWRQLGLRHQCSEEET